MTRPFSTAVADAAESELVPAAPAAARPFRLNRYFAFTSLLGIACVVALLLVFYYRVAYTTLTEHETRANAQLAHAFTNMLHPEQRAFIAHASRLNPSELAQAPAVGALRSQVREQVQGMKVVKVKIYNRAGLTVFSTDADQIGEEKGSNPGFLRALAGQSTGRITFEGETYAFEGGTAKRSFVTSYVPIVEDDKVTAVFELYSDVTDLVEGLRVVGWQVFAAVLGSLSLLYLFLALIVRRANRIMHVQERERRTHEAHIRRQAYFDPLTDLPNRRGFSEALHEQVAASSESGQRFAVIFLDLDRFKLVNDGFGHDTGDHLLRLVAKRIHARVRRPERLFRMGGDEFTLLSDAAETHDVAALAERVLHALSEPFQVAHGEIAMDTSIGIAVYPEHGRSPDELVKNADTAMYAAKRRGGNQYAIYAPELNTCALDRLELEAALQQALPRGEFHLVYQPRISAADGSLSGVEALLRWHHPERGLIMPDAFIPFLEDTGRILEVGAWVLEAACRQALEWKAKGLVVPRVSVNVSPRQFRSGALFHVVRDILERTGLSPDRLELEVTEGVVVENPDLAIDVLGQLKRIGITLALDDFGSGYSSLNYLRCFPVDFLKLDRSFVTDLSTGGRDAAIVAAAATLGKRLGLRLVGEGVESEEAARVLRRYGYHELQGLLYSEPLSPAALEQWLCRRAGERC